MGDAKSGHGLADCEGGARRGDGHGGAAGGGGRTDTERGVHRRGHITAGIVEGEGTADGVVADVVQGGTTVEDDVGAVVDFTWERCSDRGIVDRQGAVGDRHRGTTVCGSRAQGQSARIDIGIARPATVSVVAGQDQGAGSALHQSHTRAGDRRGNCVHARAGVGVNKEFGAPAGQARAAADRQVVRARVDDQTSRRNGERSADRQGRGGGGGDVQGIEGRARGRSRGGGDADVIGGRAAGKGVGGVGTEWSGVQRSGGEAERTDPSSTARAGGSVNGKVSSVHGGPTAEDAICVRGSSAVQLGEDDLAVVRTPEARVGSGEVHRRSHCSPLKVGDGQGRRQHGSGGRCYGDRVCAARARSASECHRATGSAALHSEVGERAPLHGDGVGHTVRAEIRGGVKAGVVQREGAEEVVDAAAGGETALIAQGQTAAADDSGAGVGAVAGEGGGAVARTGEAEVPRDGARESAPWAGGESGGGGTGVRHDSAGACEQTGGVERADRLVPAIEVQGAAADTDGLKCRSRRGCEHRQGVVRSAVQGEQALIDRSLATAQEELLFVDAHRTGAGLDEAVIALKVAVEVQGVQGIGLVDNQLVAAGLDHTAIEVGSAGIEHQHAAAADVEDSHVVEAVERGGAGEGQAVHGQRTIGLRTVDRDVRTRRHRPEEARREFRRRQRTQTTRRRIRGEGCAGTGRAGVRDDVGADADGVAAVARATTEEVVDQRSVNAAGRAGGCTETVTADQE